MYESFWVQWMVDWSVVLEFVEVLLGNDFWDMSATLEMRISGSKI
jgi:hypothetical protein